MGNAHATKIYLLAIVCGTALLAGPFLRGFSKKPFVSRREINNPPQYAAFAEPLPQELWVRHMLDRFTFGPRPGESTSIPTAKLNQWIDQQLHPNRLPENPLLGTKLAPYESIDMGIRETYLHYPPPQLLAAIARGQQPLPDDPELRTVVQHLVERYLRKKTIEKRVANESAPPVVAAGPKKANAGVDDDEDLEPAVPLKQILSVDQINLLRWGTNDEKHQVLAAVPADRAYDFVYALRPSQRKKLLPLAPVELQRKLLLSVSPVQVVLSDLSAAKMLRAVYSNRQLNELMTDFWFNHFNVFFGKGADRYTLPTYEREAIRPHALGRFYDLLLATAKSPAMLYYLDNWESVAPDFDQRARRIPRKNQRKRGLNENYGRELLELHTLGVNGGYSQEDVIAAARCFTGWTIAAPRKGGGFEYNDRVHDKGEKTILGHTIRAGGGMNDGLEVLQLLARQPATAHHISLELAQRFVADDPPPSLVNRMADTFLKTDGDIGEVMKTMAQSPEFWSKGAYQAKVKSPFEMVVSAVRAVNADVDSPAALVQQIVQLGEPLYRKIEPTGYSSANAEWVSSAALLGRMNFALALTNDHIHGVRVDQNQWNSISQDTLPDVAKMLLVGDPSSQTMNAIQKAMNDPGTREQLIQSAKLNQPQLPGLIAGLVIGSPEFQRR